MTRHTFVSRAAGLTAVGTALLGLSPALAQQSGIKIEEITVIAPWSVTKEVVSQTPAGGKEELISLTRHVYYGDLDLAKHADVMTLEKRVSDIAKTSCDQLAKMYPLSGPNPPNCAEKAAASAKAEMDKAIAAAAKAKP
jgi:UrcA family protein